VYLFFLYLNEVAVVEARHERLGPKPSLAILTQAFTGVFVWYFVYVVKFSSADPTLARSTSALWPRGHGHLPETKDPRFADPGLKIKSASVRQSDE